MKKALLYFLFVFAYSGSYAQLICDAGADKTLCPGTTVTIGGSPAISGGTGPFIITWTPATGLSSTTTANPTITALTADVTYTLTVRDSRDSVDTDVVTVFFDEINLMNAGVDEDICLSDSTPVTLGSANNYYNPYRFKWSPSTWLNNDTVPRPIATPTVSTTYTLQITSPACGIKTSYVTISVHSLVISAGADTTINEGESVTLYADPFDSTYVYYWSSSNGAINYPSTYNPDVSPKDTADYVLSVKDPWGCIYYDIVRVNVIPSAELYFYNSITPNGDGENDVWVIRNLEKYPKNELEIFNRYGQQIYSVHGYNNDWNGKYLGQELPAGTYFFVLDTGTDKEKYKGSITIFR